MIRSTYHTVLNASPGAAKLERDMLFDIPFIADQRKLETIGKVKLILITCVKNVLIMIIKLTIKYLYGTKVFSAQHGYITNHGPLSQFIRMNNQGKTRKQVSKT
jgi:hypothetical protein